MIAPTPSRTWAGRPGGGDAGYGAVTAPSRPALMTGSDSCTQNRGYFRDEMVEKLRGKATPCSLFGFAETTPFRSHLTLFRASSFRKEGRILNCVDYLTKIECSRFLLVFVEHHMLLPDSCHGRDARLTLTWERRLTPV